MADDRPPRWPQSPSLTTLEEACPPQSAPLAAPLSAGHALSPREPPGDTTGPLKLLPEKSGEGLPQLLSGSRGLHDPLD